MKCHPYISYHMYTQTVYNIVKIIYCNKTKNLNICLIMNDDVVWRCLKKVCSITLWSHYFTFGGVFVWSNLQCIKILNYWTLRLWSQSLRCVVQCLPSGWPIQINSPDQKKHVIRVVFVCFCFVFCFFVTRCVMCVSSLGSQNQTYIFC